MIVWSPVDTAAPTPAPETGSTFQLIAQSIKNPGLVWSYAGIPSGYSSTECLLMNSGQTDWNDNYLCVHTQGFFNGWSFSAAGSLSTVAYSVRIYEPLQAGTSDDYLYIPTNTTWGFTFSYSGLITGIPVADCIPLNEPSTASWDDNYLCSYTLSPNKYIGSSNPVAIGSASVEGIMYNFYLAFTLVYCYTSDLSAGTTSNPKVVPFVSATYAYMATAIDPTVNTWDSIKKLVFADMYNPYVAYTYSLSLGVNGTFSLPVALPVNVPHPFSATLYQGQLILIYTTGTTLAYRRESNSWTEVSEVVTATGIPSCTMTPPGVVLGSYVECSFIGNNGRATIDYFYLSCPCNWLNDLELLSTSTSVSTTRNTRSYSHIVGTYVSGTNLMILSGDVNGYLGSGAPVSTCTIGSGVLSYNIMRNPSVPYLRDIYVADVLRTDGILRCDIGVLSGSSYTCDCYIVEQSSDIGPYLIYTSDPQPYFCNNECEYLSCWTDKGHDVVDNHTHMDLGLNSQYDSLVNVRQLLEVSLGGVYQGHVITGDLNHEEEHPGMRTWWNVQYPRLKRDFAPVYLLKGNHDGLQQYGFDGAMELTEWIFYAVRDLPKYIQAIDASIGWIFAIVRMIYEVAGSTAYSFQSGKYLVISLHDIPLQEMSMDDNGVNSFDAESRTRQALDTYLHRVSNSVGWLTTELKYAAASHLRVIINMHRSDGSGDHVSHTYTLTDVGNLMMQYRNNIAAIFVGHIHDRHGQVSDDYQYTATNIPVVYVGSRTHRSYTIVRLGNDEIETIPFTHGWDGSWSLGDSKVGTCRTVGSFGTYKIASV